MAIKPRPKPQGVNPKEAALVGGANRKAFSFEGTELGATLSEIHTNFGEEVARVGSSIRRYTHRVRTNIFALDLALAGGFLVSRGSMLYGEKSAGKSTCAMMLAVQAQIDYPDMVVVWNDVEGTFDEVWFRKLGGDLDRLVLMEPESGEHAVDIADAVARAKETSMLVTDSIAMLVPMKEIEAAAADSLPGIHARLVGNYLRRINNAMLIERHRGHHILVMHINQFRMKVGLSFGDPRVLPGGKALEFATTQQVEVRNSEKLDQNSGMIKWNEHTFKVTKDKTGGQMREGKYKMTRAPKFNDGFPEGTIYQAGTILEAAAAIGLADGKELMGFGKAAGKEAWQAKFLADPEMFVRATESILMAYRKEWGLDTGDFFEKHKYMAR